MSPKHILVIEDDLGIQNVIQIVLESEGYWVTSASNGQEALEKITQGRLTPDLILLDLMMPIVDGETFLNELKARHSSLLERCRVVIMTAVSRPTVDRCFPLLRKPIELEVLITTIRENISA